MEAVRARVLITIAVAALVTGGILPSVSGNDVAVRPLEMPRGGPQAESAAMLAALHGNPLARLEFVENAGQWEASVRFAFLGDGPAVFGDGYFALGLPARQGAELSARGQRQSSPDGGDRTWVRVVFMGAAARTLVGQHEMPHRSNLYPDADPARWREGVRSFSELVYPDLYPGIDLRFRVSGGGLKYEFVAGAGSDPQRILLSYDGATRLSVDSDGGLDVDVRGQHVRDSPPVAFAEGEPIACAFVLRGSFSAGFHCPGLNPRSAFVIDPLIYSTFLGGSGRDVGYTIRVDAQGSAYVAGGTLSSDFPKTLGGRNSGAFVVKLNPAGSGLIYATVLGGNDAFGLAIDASGNAYVTGSARANFPVTPGAFDTTASGSDDAFVAKLSPTGTLVYGTYLGAGLSAMDYGHAIAVDASGRATVVGFAESTDFPTTPGAFDQTHNGGWDAFVSRLSPDGSALEFSTFLGSTYTDLATGVALDTSGNVFVVGFTYSPDYPTTPGAFDRTHNGRLDIFLTKLNASGDRLFYSTFLGGSGDEGNAWFMIVPAGVAVDSLGSAYVAGRTFSADFPTTPGAFDRTPAGDDDAFVAKFDPTGSALEYSTLLGGNGTDLATAIAVDPSGNAYVTGAASPGFPVTQGAVNSTVVGWTDVFVAKLDPTGGSLLHSTFLGSTGWDYGAAIAIDTSGAAYVTGYAHVGDFPTTPGAFDTDYPGFEFDAFVSKLDMTGVPLHAITVDTDPSGLSVTIEGMTQRAPVTFYCDGDSTRSVGVDSPQSAGTSRYVFRSWSDLGAQTHTIACDGSKTLVAAFDREIQYVFDTRPTALDLIVDGATISARTEYWWALGSTHTVAVPSPQVTPTATYRFSAWNDGGARNRTIASGLAASLVAMFDAAYRLTVVSGRGPASCDVPDCWYAVGSTARVTVETPFAGPPGTRYVFLEWSGDATGSTPTLSVLIDSDKTVTAVWATEHLVTATSAYGTVSGGGWILEGATAMVSVSPTEVTVGGRVLRFVGWTGDIASHSAAVTFPVDGPKSLSAQWVDASAGGIPSSALIALVAVAVIGVALVVYALRRRRRRAS